MSYEELSEYYRAFRERDPLAKHLKAKEAEQAQQVSLPDP